MAALHISKRSKNLIASPIRKFLPLVYKAESKGVKFFKLNVGDPDIETPKEIIADAQHYKSKNIPYAPSPGVKEHVASWLKYYSDIGIKTLKPANIIPTQGAAEAITMAIMAITDPGDEVVVFEPIYTSYKGFAALCDIKFRPVTLRIENNFALPLINEISKKISKKTKAIIIINPDNPTGKVWNKQELKQIIGLAKKHNLFIISDETYRGIVFKGKAETILNYNAALKYAIVVDSLSKRFSAPGLRIGALVSYNKEVMDAILKMAMVRLSVQTIGQLSTIKILRNHRAYVKKIAREYKRRSAVVNNALKNYPGVLVSRPVGAFYQVIRLPLKNSEDFIKFLITKFRYQNKTVLVTPMQDFYITPNLGLNEIRLAYVLNVKAMKEAMLIFKKALKAYLEKQ